jgi:hypothetical protein
MSIPEKKAMKSSAPYRSFKSLILLGSNSLFVRFFISKAKRVRGGRKQAISQRGGRRIVDLKKTCMKRKEEEPTPHKEREVEGGEKSPDSSHLPLFSLTLRDFDMVGVFLGGPTSRTIGFSHPK